MSTISTKTLDELRDQALTYVGGAIHTELDRVRYRAYLDALTVTMSVQQEREVKHRARLFDLLRDCAQFSQPSQKLSMREYIPLRDAHTRFFNEKCQEYTGFTPEELTVRVQYGDDPSKHPYNPDTWTGEHLRVPVSERVDCPSCGEGLAWDDAWTGTGSACKVCGYQGKQDPS